MRVLLGIAGVVDDLGIGGTVIGCFTCQRAVVVVFVCDRIACIAPGYCALLGKLAEQTPDIANELNAYRI